MVDFEDRRALVNSDGKLTAELISLSGTYAQALPTHCRRTVAVIGIGVLGALRCQHRRRCRHCRRGRALLFARSSFVSVRLPATSPPPREDAAVAAIASRSARRAAFAVGNPSAHCSSGPMAKPLAIPPLEMWTLPPSIKNAPPAAEVPGIDSPPSSTAWPPRNQTPVMFTFRLELLDHLEQTAVCVRPDTNPAGGWVGALGRIGEYADHL